jgi:hypothetical protein
LQVMAQDLDGLGHLVLSGLQNVVKHGWLSAVSFQPSAVSHQHPG